MAGSISGYLEKKLLDLVFGGTAYSAPATLYFGLLTDTNTDAQRAAGTFTEVSGNGYARASVTNNTTNFGAATGTAPASKTNATQINFPTPSGTGWGTIQAIGVFDAATGGNLLWVGPLTSPVTVPAGATVYVAANGLNVQLA